MGSAFGKTIQTGISNGFEDSAKGTKDIEKCQINDAPSCVTNAEAIPKSQEKSQKRLPHVSFNHVSRTGPHGRKWRSLEEKETKTLPPTERNRNTISLSQHIDHHRSKPDQSDNTSKPLGRRRKRLTYIKAHLIDSAPCYFKNPVENVLEATKQEGIRLCLGNSVSENDSSEQKGRCYEKSSEIEETFPHLMKTIQLEKSNGYEESTKGTSYIEKRQKDDAPSCLTSADAIPTSHERPPQNLFKYLSKSGPHGRKWKSLEERETKTIPPTEWNRNTIFLSRHIDHHRSKLDQNDNTSKPLGRRHKRLSGTTAHLIDSAPYYFKNPVENVLEATKQDEGIRLCLGNSVSENDSSEQKGRCYEKSFEIKEKCPHRMKTIQIEKSNGFEESTKGTADVEKRPKNDTPSSLTSADAIPKSHERPPQNFFKHLSSEQKGMCYEKSFEIKEKCPHRMKTIQIEKSNGFEESTKGTADVEKRPKNDTPSSLTSADAIPKSHERPPQNFFKHLSSEQKGMCYEKSFEIKEKCPHRMKTIQIEKSNGFEESTKGTVDIEKNDTPSCLTNAEAIPKSQEKSQKRLPHVSFYHVSRTGPHGRKWRSLEEKETITIPSTEWNRNTISLSRHIDHHRSKPDNTSKSLGRRHKRMTCINAHLIDYFKNPGIRLCLGNSVSETDSSEQKGRCYEKSFEIKEKCPHRIDYHVSKAGQEDKERKSFEENNRWTMRNSDKPICFVPSYQRKVDTTPEPKEELPQDNYISESRSILFEGKTENAGNRTKRFIDFAPSYPSDANKSPTLGERNPQHIYNSLITPFRHRDRGTHFGRNKDVLIDLGGPFPGSAEKELKQIGHLQPIDYPVPILPKLSIFPHVLSLPQITGIPQNERIELHVFGKRETFLVFSKTEKIQNAMNRALERDGSASLTVSFYYDLIKLDDSKSFSEELTTFPAKVYAVFSPQERIPRNYITKGEDCLGLADEEEQCVIMPCGHIIAPSSLIEYVKDKIRNRRWSITCPSPEHKKDYFWEFHEIQDRICMTTSERIFFEKALSHNLILDSPTTFSCPECKLTIDDEGSKTRIYFVCRACNNTRFCKTCWNAFPETAIVCKQCNCNRDVQEILRECTKINIIGMANCPSVRLCPRCKALIEIEDKGCKHMTCRCGCKFCFICLRVKPDSELYYPCENDKGGAFEQCELAKTQRGEEEETIKNL